MPNSICRECLIGSDWRPSSGVVLREDCLLKAGGGSLYSAEISFSVFPSRLRRLSDVDYAGLPGLHFAVSFSIILENKINSLNAKL